MSHWADAKNENRWLIDLAVVPEVSYPNRNEQSSEVVWHLQLPVGYTWARVTAASGRVVRESYGPGSGFNAGPVGGFDAAWGHHGFYVQGG